MDRKCADLKRLIFTGTPGSGKTSVIKELEKLGYVVVCESATDVISTEQTKGMERPWEKPEFVDQIMRLQKERQMHAIGDVQFYDRSPFCTYALAKYLGHKISEALETEIQHCLKNNVYQNQVFFFENLGFVEMTSARKISYEEALIFEQIHLNVYKQFDFEIIMVPKELTVIQRCEFILERVK